MNTLSSTIPLHATLTAQNAAALAKMTPDETEAMSHGCEDCGEDAVMELFGLWFCDNCKPAPPVLTVASAFNEQYYPRLTNDKWHNDNSEIERTYQVYSEGMRRVLIARGVIEGDSNE